MHSSCFAAHLRAHCDRRVCRCRSSLPASSKLELLLADIYKPPLGSTNPVRSSVSDATMEELSEQMRQNLIRNVAEAQSRPVGDPADWEI